MVKQEKDTSQDLLQQFLKGNSSSAYKKAKIY
jgi:hypothetical protein